MWHHEGQSDAWIARRKGRTEWAIHVFIKRLLEKWQMHDCIAWMFELPRRGPSSWHSFCTWQVHCRPQPQPQQSSHDCVKEFCSCHGAVAIRQDEIDELCGVGYMQKKNDIKDQDTRAVYKICYGWINNVVHHAAELTWTSEILSVHFMSCYKAVELWHWCTTSLIHALIGTNQCTFDTFACPI